MLKPLREEIEARYCNGCLTPIALAWGKFVDAELPERWAIDGVVNQSRFFAQHVAPWLNEAENRRAFVIVSDAMRYEVAAELTGYLNGTYRFQAELSSQLGVLPSYTALGMASLLPHSELEYTAKGDVLADGKPTASLDQRNEILSGRGGMAVKADQLLGDEEGRRPEVHRRQAFRLHLPRRD